MPLTQKLRRLANRNLYTISLKADTESHQMEELRYWHASLEVHKRLVTAFNNPIIPLPIITSLLCRGPHSPQTFRFGPKAHPSFPAAIDVEYVGSLCAHLRDTDDPLPQHYFGFDEYHLIVAQCREDNVLIELHRFLLHTVRLELLAVDTPHSSSSVKKALVVNVIRHPSYLNRCNS